MIDLAGVTALIIAVSALITALATYKKVTQIDHAVNGRVKGSETVGEQVETATAVLPLVKQIHQNTRPNTRS